MTSVVSLLLVYSLAANVFLGYVVKKRHWHLYSGSYWCSTKHGAVCNQSEFTCPSRVLALAFSHNHSQNDHYHDNSAQIDFDIHEFKLFLISHA